ncbi:RNHCP domain-containing protein [Saccharopolyspora sp. NPDC050642]|uniref:RNHCP domain-containing protein n=1 Tax=Saccharopolyspora sp. NPDC050642 TaxID=3157099 RepID=UPI0033BFDFCA
MPRRTSRARAPQRAKRTHHDTTPRSFRCVGCRLDIAATAPGTAHRNHCPICLASRHVDELVPGDRRSLCGARMDAIAVIAHDDGEWALLHQCARCQRLGTNRIAGDDNPLQLVRLALAPIAQPISPDFQRNWVAV